MGFGQYYVLISYLVMEVFDPSIKVYLSIYLRVFGFKTYTKKIESSDWANGQFEVILGIDGKIDGGNWEEFGRFL